MTGPIERYHRVSLDIPGGSIEAGLWRNRGEPCRMLRDELRRVLQDLVKRLNGEAVTDDTAGSLTDALEAAVKATWPARPWFVEVWNADEALTQVYAPYGMPRSR